MPERAKSFIMLLFFYGEVFLLHNGLQNLEVFDKTDALNRAW